MYTIYFELIQTHTFHFPLFIDCLPLQYIPPPRTISMDSRRVHVMACLICTWVSHSFLKFNFLMELENFLPATPTSQLVSQKPE